MITFCKGQISHFTANSAYWALKLALLWLNATSNNSGCIDDSFVLPEDISLRRDLNSGARLVEAEWCHTRLSPLSQSMVTSVPLVLNFRIKFHELKSNKEKKFYLFFLIKMKRRLTIFLWKEETRWLKYFAASRFQLYLQDQITLLLFLSKH